MTVNKDGLDLPIADGKIRQALSGQIVQRVHTVNLGYSRTSWAFAVVCAVQKHELIILPWSLNTRTHA